MNTATLLIRSVLIGIGLTLGMGIVLGWVLLLRGLFHPAGPAIREHVTRWLI